MSSKFTNPFCIKKLILTIFGLLTLFTAPSSAQEHKTKFNFYGFIRNDFFYNSRQNVESIDGVFHIIPKPIEIKDGKDVNAAPQAELLSIASRVGVDITSIKMLGAESSAKLEADFAGFGSNFYVLRIRQAYFKLNWENTELLLGQTWHPLFGNVTPTIVGLNAGVPFEPFNRSPQLRVKQNLGKTFSLIASANYQMQYVSQGPIGSSASYLKNALLPSFFLGIESKTNHWVSGAGVDLKTIKPSDVKNTSISAVIYTQYTKSLFQIKGKAVWGENLSDYLMLSGYGVSKADENGNVLEYTNFNIISTWLNAVYGKKWRTGIFLGFSQNLGTNKLLMELPDGIIAYGYGFYKDKQLLLDRYYRISPHVSFNLPKLTFGLEYDFTSALYGTIRKDGRVNNPYTVNNHRAVASVCYHF